MDITNITEVSFADYSKYRDFTTLMTSRRGINRLFYLLVALSSLALFFPIGDSLVRGANNGDTTRLVLSILVFIPASAGMLLNWYVLFVTNRLTLVARRVGMFLTCLVLSIVFIVDFSDNDLFINVLTMILPVASLAGVFLPRVMARRDYAKIAGLSYQYEFAKSVKVTVKVPVRGETTQELDYRLAVYDVGGLYFMFYNPQTAIFVSKTGFIKGDCEQFERLLYRHNVKVKVIKW